ncbi:MAG TPA: S24 family peptidase, partial [Nannocystis sp.]
RERPKSHLTVVDMVGNHRAFLDRLDALDFLIEDARPRGDVLRALRAKSLNVPPGCAVELPTEFVEVLEQLLVREREAESRAAVLALHPPIRLKLTHNDRNPILILDRKLRPDTPEGEIEVEADGETYMFRFAKIAVNVAKQPGSEGNVLPVLLRGWFGPEAGWGKDYVALSFRRGRWHLEPVRASAAPIRHGVRYFPDLAVACGLGPLVHGEPEDRVVAVRTERDVDTKRHFVVRAEGDSMAGGETPIHDGDLVLCEWANGASLEEVAGRPCVLVIHDGPEHTEVVLKIPARKGEQWVLRSQAPGTRDRIIPAGAEVRVIARALGSVLLA